MNPRVFREYDIRGDADRDLDDGFANDLGSAIGTHLRRAGAKRITLGRDCRVTSPRLHTALRAGLLSTGIDVIDVGVVATPLLYFSRLPLRRRRRRADHRPPQPARGQRLQDPARQVDHPRRRDPGAAQARRGARLRDRARRASRSSDIERGLPRHGGVAHRARAAPLQGRGRRRQRRRRHRGAALPAARLRRDAALLRARRPLPQPPPRSDRREERRRPEGQGRRGRRRGRHRARRRRRSHRRGRRQGAHRLGRPADDPVRALDPDGGAGRDLRRRGEVLARRSTTRSRRPAARRSCGRSATRSSRRR